jgi:hypothetical protein
MSDKESSSSFPLNKHSDKPTQKPKQHRCNAHLEDVLEGLSQWPMNVSKPFGAFLDCLKSKPGKKDEYHHHDQNN